MSRKLTYASRASDRHRPPVAGQRPAARAKAASVKSRSTPRLPLGLLLGLPLLGFLSFLVLAHAWMNWQVQRLHQEQALLREVFQCTERRFNNPGTFGGTRCLRPDDVDLNRFSAASPTTPPPPP